MAPFTQSFGFDVNTGLLEMSDCADESQWVTCLETSNPPLGHFWRVPASD